MYFYVGAGKNFDNLQFIKKKKHPVDIRALLINPFFMNTLYNFFRKLIYS